MGRSRVVVVVDNGRGDIALLERMLVHLQASMTGTAREGLLLLKQRRADTLVLVHPLADQPLFAFLRSVRSSVGPEQSLRILVLSPAKRLAELGGYRSEDLDILSLDLPKPELLDRVAAYFSIPPRIRRRLPVQILTRLPEGRITVDCTSCNVSVTGVLVVSEALLPVGLHVAAQIELPDSTQIRTHSEVVRHTAPEIEGVRGFALRFIGFEARGRELLEAFIENEATGLRIATPAGGARA